MRSLSFAAGFHYVRQRHHNLQMLILILLLRFYHKLHATLGYRYTYKRAIQIDQLTRGAFADAAWAVRPDDSSQGGYFIYAADQDLIEGRDAHLFILD